MQMLLRNGPHDMNAQGARDGDSVLMAAARSGQQIIVRVLIDNGAEQLLGARAHTTPPNTPSPHAKRA